MNDTVRTVNQVAAPVTKVMAATGDDSGGNWVGTDQTKRLCNSCKAVNEMDATVCKECGGSMTLKSAQPLDFTYAKTILQVPDEQLQKLLAVKSVGTDRIFHYSFLWGDSRVTDLEQEYFTKHTNMWDEQLKNLQRPLTWDHAMDPSMKSSPVIGKTLEYGNDDIGRWAISQLDRAHAYRRAIDTLLEAGVLGSSSDSTPQYVERVQTGKSYWLKTWPWFATALTVTPCEPRMVKTVDYFKSIGMEIPNPEASVSQMRAMVLKTRRIFTL